MENACHSDIKTQEMALSRVKTSPLEPCAFGAHIIYWQTVTFFPRSTAVLYYILYNFAVFITKGKTNFYFCNNGKQQCCNKIFKHCVV